MTTIRNKKGLLTMVLVAAMAALMAVPTFAEGVSPRADLYSWYSIQSVDNGKFLTRTGTYSNANVYLSGNAQSWLPGRYNGITKLYANISTNGGTQYVAKYNSGSVVLAPENEDYGTTSVELYTVGGNVHRIFFNQRATYLCASGDNVTTAWYDENATTLKWYLS